MLKRSPEKKNRRKKRLSIDILAVNCLQDISMRFVNQENITGIYAKIVEAAMTITESDKGILQIFDMQSKHLKIVAQSGFEQNFLDYFDIVKVGKAVSGTALQQGRRVRVEDVKKSPLFAESAMLDTVLKAGVRAVQATPLVSRSGQFLGMLSTHYQQSNCPDEQELYFFDLLASQAADIIERIQFEQDLQDAECGLALFAGQMEQKENLLHSVREFIIVRDIENRIVFWNGGAQRGYGWTMEEARGQEIHRLLKTQSQDSLSLNEIHSKLFKQGYWHGDLVHQTKSGLKITVDSYWTLNYDATGKPQTVIEINHDVTELRELQKSMEVVKERRFRSVFDSMFQLTGVLTPEGVLIDCNKTALDYMTCEYAETVKRYFWEIPCWRQLDNTETKIRQAIQEAASGIFVRFETRIRDRYGKVAFMDFSIKPVCDEQGKVVMLISEGRDITTQKSYEQEMSRLSRMNLVGEMAVAIGHEVRNPLTTVRGYLQYFSTKKQFLACAEQFAIMIQELDRANGIITDFLSLAQNRSVKLTQSSLNEIIEGLYPAMQATALEKGALLVLDLNPVSELLLDQKDICQLLLNLIRNSFEAIEGQGTVTIKTYQEGRAVILAVCDTGKGIEPRIFEKLGTPFMTTKEDGIGLGLPVCFRIVERHKAKMTVDTGNKGTTIFIKFVLKI